MDDPEHASPRPALPRTINIEEGKDHVLEQGEEVDLEFVKDLGYGHSSHVEAVKDGRSGALYARKTFRIPVLQRARDEQRNYIQNEMNIIRSLAPHRHVVRVFATYSARREFSLLLQPVADEGDLESFLEYVFESLAENESCRSRGIGERELDILQKAFGCLAAGLEFIHRSQVRHKDIKPKNILIHRGRVLYTDFGYSRPSIETTTGKPDFLTRRYSAPEVLNHDNRNLLADVFSLGCVFVDMLSVMDDRLEETRLLCFGEDIDRLHGVLREKITSSHLVEVMTICVSMTQNQPQKRPTALACLNEIRDLPEYLCSDCSTANSTTSTISAEPKTGINGTLQQRQEFNSWIWSEDHQDHYYVTYGKDGGYVYLWGKDVPRPGQMSGAPYVATRQPQPLPTSTRQLEPGLISGTPDRGWYEALDSSYRMRTWNEAHRFFTRGRVFSMLYTEPAEAGSGRNNDGFSEVKLGGLAYTQIRRFIIVKVQHDFVYACAILTYGGRATFKPGIVPSEHSAVHLNGTELTYLSGERERGLLKDPISIIPADLSVTMSSFSRLRYSKTFPVEMNVKVKDIGVVDPRCLDQCLSYWKQEFGE